MKVRRYAALLCAALFASNFQAGVAAAAPLAADPSAGFSASATVSRPDGAPRTDGAIAVGDDLVVNFAAVDGTPATACYIRMIAIGGEVMDTPGAIADGACTLAVRLPEFPDPDRRAMHPAGAVALDLCVWPLTISFADGEGREMRADDRLSPGGRDCGTGGSDPGFTAKLDFPVAADGAARPFVSDPPMLSWNPADWGTDMEPLQFGVPWHLELPAWVTSCWSMLRGSWLTSIRAERSPTCEPWDVRIPGILPATLPWTGPLGDWDHYIDTFYASGVPGPDSMTISAARMPIATSDGVFTSNRRAVFPIDLASARFVTVGDRWQPVFQVSGSDIETCTLELIASSGSPGGGTSEWFTVVPDADGQCAFDLAAMAENEYHQYYVTVAATGVVPSDIVFGGSISAIPAPAPPVIEPPTEEPGGETGIGVEPGDGNGLVVDLSVEPAATGVALLAAEAGDPACADRAVSTNLESGGAVPHLDARCALPAGTYEATATMVDAAGKTSTTTRLLTVPQPRPVVVTRFPASGATGVPRDVRPSATFDVDVAGLSASTVRLRDVATGSWVPVTVTYDATHRRVTLRSSTLRGAGRWYRVYLSSGITSKATGRPLASTSWTFRVTTDATRPTFTRTPRAGATGISRTANVALQFSERVRGVSGSTIRLKDAVTGSWIAAAVTYDATLHRATLNPSSTLRGSRRYVVYVTSSIKDIAGNPVSATSWSFTTRA